MNVITLTGRLVKDKSQLKITIGQNGQGKKKLTCSMAVNREMAKDKTDFFNVVVWGKTAEFVEKWYQKGVMIEVSGSIFTDQYNDPTTGQPKSFTYVNADKFTFLPKNNGVFTTDPSISTATPNVLNCLSQDIFEITDDAIIYD